MVETLKASEAYVEVLEQRDITREVRASGVYVEVLTRNVGNPDNQHIELHAVKGGPLRLKLRDSGSDFMWVEGDVAAAGINLYDGTAHHVALTFDNAATPRLYVDGTELSTTKTGDMTLPGSWGNFTKPITFGGRFATDSASFEQGGFDGVMDEVALYSSVLSSTRVSAHYSAMIDPSGVSGVGLTPQFTADVIDWKWRLSGDEETNPMTDLVLDHHRIADLSVHRDRLILAGADRVVMSQSGDLFNHWVENAENLVDSDPIDAACSSSNDPTRAVEIDFLTPFQKAVLIFSRSGQQFELNAPEVLSPDTAAITASTGYDTLPDVRPVISGVVAYFGSASPKGLQLYEYEYDEGSVSNVAVNVVEHAEGYIPTNIHRIAACSNLNVVAMVETDGYAVYLYRTFWQGNERVMSATSRILLAATDRICDLAIIGTDAYLLVEHDSIYDVWKLPLSEDEIPTGMDYAPALDNWTSVTGTNAAGETTWDYTYADAAIDCVVLGADFDANAGTVLTGLTRVDAHTVKIADAAGDYSGSAAYVGRKVALSSELSRPYTRDRSGAARLDGDMVLHYLTLTHHNTGDYSVKVVIPDTPDFTTTFAPDSGLVSDAGETLCFVRGFADGTTVTIESDSPLPCTIVTGEWTATFQPRG